MTIWEISEKADYIAERHRRLQDQWRIYCNSLVQGITLSKARLHHAMSCAPDKDLCFVLFEHFTIYVTLADGFNSHTIEYYVETKDGDDKQLIAQAELTLDRLKPRGLPTFVMMRFHSASRQFREWACRKMSK